MEQKMFCYQCQETAGCKGCTMSGVCGKKPDVAAMQDLLVYVCLLYTSKLPWTPHCRLPKAPACVFHLHHF